MPFSDSQSHLRDIIGAIDAIQQFTEGMDAAAFHADAKTRAAVERKFLVIGDCVAEIPRAQRQHPENTLVHASERLSVNEPFESFDAKRELSQSRRSLA